MDESGLGVSPKINETENSENLGRDGQATQEATIHKRQGAFLPHWTLEGGIYAVTFRLNDSLPRHVWESWLDERRMLLDRARKTGCPLSRAEEDRLCRLNSERVEQYLDAGHGACHLAKPAVAALVAGALTHFDGDRYLMHAWCVMPNHVHAVVQPLGKWPLEGIVHSWKSFTSHKANVILSRSGTFWQQEPYDHLIRDEDDYNHAVEYAWGNPDAAGLMDWKWRGLGVSPKDSEFNLGRDGQAT